MKIIFIISLLFLSWESTAQQVNLQLFAGGFNQPIGIKNTGVSNDARLFVVEQGGVIRILNPNGSTIPTPFLDLSAKVSTGNEQGLLDVAFHPDFANNGYFFVNYTDLNGDTQISRFTVDGVNPNVADSTSEFPIIDYTQPATNHNGGCLQFGADGYLYIASGDGGGSPGTRSQDLNNLLGKILRIDVDNISGSNNYGIPPTNPFTNDPNALDEIWAYGFRNPWRFSIDEVNGNIWIGDVGQGDIEEIDRSPISSGGLNYGWPCYEGSQAYNTNGCLPASTMVFPFAEYSSATGSGNCSVTGGYVYQGSMYTDIFGLYFFADYCSGMIGTIDNAGNVIDHGIYNGSWSSFGKDIEGELYLVDIGGSIYKIEGGVMSVNSTEIKPVKMYPNPVSEMLYVISEEDPISEICIFDFLGKLVYDKKNSSSTKLNISAESLKKGVYFVKMKLASELICVQKLIVR